MTDPKHESFHILHSVILNARIDNSELTTMSHLGSFDIVVIYIVVT